MELRFAIPVRLPTCRLTKTHENRKRGATTLNLPYFTTNRQNPESDVDKTKNEQLVEQGFHT
jgi:hypothetical protein